MKNLLTILLLLVAFSCTIKSNVYTVTAIQETTNGCTYTVTGGTMSMFIWNEPQMYVFEDSCGLYKAGITIDCLTLNTDYNLDTCRK